MPLVLGCRSRRRASDSASGRSNGVRFPSASAATKKMKNAVNVKRAVEEEPVPGRPALRLDDPLHAERAGQGHDGEDRERGGIS